MDDTAIDTATFAALQRDDRRRVRARTGRHVPARGAGDARPTCERALADGNAERLPSRRAFAQVERQHVRRAGRWARSRATSSCPASAQVERARRRAARRAVEAEYARVAGGADGAARCAEAAPRPAPGCWSPTTTRSTGCCSRATSSCRATAVASAENGRVALEMLRRERFDLVLLDMEMPEMDGFQVLEPR